MRISDWSSDVCSSDLPDCWRNWETAMSDWQPSASLAALKQRAGLYAMIRRFFSERAVIEVETPVLSRGGNPDPNIQSLTLSVSQPQAKSSRRWLRTSPEFALKRLQNGRASRRARVCQYV